MKTAKRDHEDTNARLTVTTKNGHRVHVETVTGETTLDLDAKIGPAITDLTKRFRGDYYFFIDRS